MYPHCKHANIIYLPTNLSIYLYLYPPTNPSTYLPTHLRTPQRELRRQAWRRGLAQRAARDAEDAATLARLAIKNPHLNSGVLHGYASQSVNIKDMLLSGEWECLSFVLLCLLCLYYIAFILILVQFIRIASSWIGNNKLIYYLQHVFHRYA
jgi:hypothetical protein